jgi:hypothetical protein
MTGWLIVLIVVLVVAVVGIQICRISTAWEDDV